MMLIVMLSAGCVGYNQTLFMTKSNAGLDFDAKPPTAEVNISRKEGVIAPTFEGGKTPPVMASFGSKVGTGGGVGRFFFGVDQTFAGGDAAVTMAKLYADPRPAEDKAFPSEFTISKLPKGNEGTSGKIRRFLFGLPVPGEVKPLIFGTDTQLGVKVGWTGIGGAYPDTIKVGFNRKEVALAPVTLTPDEGSQATKAHKVQMPSFLATVESNVEGSNGVKVGWMQYFATGDSANQLARQPGVRAAMLKRADPGQEKAIDQKIQEEAAGANEKRDGQIEEIIGKILSSDKKTVDKVKLTTIASGVRGLDQTWIDTYGDKTPDKLRETLRSFDQASVPDLYNNRSKIQ